MTSNKAAKRAIRARMDKTGERYTAARRHVVSQRENANAAPAPDHAIIDIDAAHELDATPSDSRPEPEPAVVAPEAVPDLPSPALLSRIAEPAMSDEAIRRGTGRSWDEWFALLDGWGAPSRSHADIARHVEDAWGINGWWAQSVTVGYEQARGMRAPNQRPDGFFFTASKTVAASAAVVHAAFVEDVLRDRWLEPGTLRLRTQQPARSARFDVLPDAGRLMLTITEKGAGKTLAAIEHGRLSSSDEVEVRRAFWRERLTRLAALAQRLDPPGEDREAPRSSAG